MESRDDEEDYHRDEGKVTKENLYIFVSAKNTQGGYTYIMSTKYSVPGVFR